MTLSDDLKIRSKEVCDLNGCTDDNHQCESYAYIDEDMNLLDVCCSDYFAGSSKPYAAIFLPWGGSQADLEKEVKEQVWDQKPE